MPRDDAPTDRGSRGDRPSLLSGGGLVVAVLAVLLFAAARQIDGRTHVARPSVAAPAAAPNPTGQPALARPIEAGDSRPVLDPLSRRTLEDPVRLAHAGSFTLQIAMACRKDTALRLLDRAERSTDLYVLPALSGGQECYRFCWGAFEGRESALMAQLPAGLRGADLGNPTPRRIQDLTP